MELPLTNLTRRVDPQKAMALGYVLIGGGLSLLVFGASLPVLVISIIVLTFGEMIAMPIASSYVADLAPDDMRGRYMGVLGFSWNTAIGIGPMVGLWIFGHSPDFLWALCGVAGVMAAFLILIRTKQPAT